MKFDQLKISTEVLKILYDQKKVAESWNIARADGHTDRFGIAGGDEIETWELGLPRFGNQFPSICYAYGISLETLQSEFPQIFSAKYHYDHVKGPDWPTYENFVLKNYKDIDKEILEEILDQNRWDWYKIEKVQKDFYQGNYNQYFLDIKIDSLIHFINEHRRRLPKKILEIGGGRGEIANLFKKLGASCVSIDPGQYSDVLYEYTGKLFFGEEFDTARTLSIDLEAFTEKFDLNQFNTIIFCESIEHCSESGFWAFWQKLKSTFSGLVIIVNWIYYHPIPVMFPEHIFEINDTVYDHLVNESKRCVYRNHSHLVLEL